MDELRDYLNKSKTKRHASVKRAKKLMTQYKRENSSITRINENSFPSVNQKNFKRYEQNLNLQIKEIFNPNPLKYLESSRNSSSKIKMYPYASVYLNSLSTSLNSSSRSKLHQSQLMQDLQKRLESRIKGVRKIKNLSLQSKFKKNNKSLEKL
jgi:virulence-associated protein VapD